MYLSIGTLKNNFQFFSNAKLFIFRCPKVKAHASQFMMCIHTGPPKTINFPFGTNGKLMVFGVPILKHFRVCIKVLVLCTSSDNVLYMYQVSWE